MREILSYLHIVKTSCMFYMFEATVVNEILMQALSNSECRLKPVLTDIFRCLITTSQVPALIQGFSDVRQNFSPHSTLTAPNRYFWIYLLGNKKMALIRHFPTYRNKHNSKTNRSYQIQLIHPLSHIFRGWRNLHYLNNPELGLFSIQKISLN